jgi:hypothetical protein
MREIMLPLLRDMHRRVPALFADLYAAFERDMPEAAPDCDTTAVSLSSKEATSPRGTATAP